jgi:hypothetical protein
MTQFWNEVFFLQDEYSLRYNSIIPRLCLFESRRFASSTEDLENSSSLDAFKAVGQIFNVTERFTEIPTVLYSQGFIRNTARPQFLYWLKPVVPLR